MCTDWNGIIEASDQNKILTFSKAITQRKEKKETHQQQLSHFQFPNYMDITHTEHHLSRAHFLCPMVSV